MTTARLLADLAEVVGPAHVLTDPAVTSAYCTDWTGRWRGVAQAVVRPADTAQTAEVVRRCAAAGVAICPQGGNTGLVGGGVPPADGRPTIVLSMTRLTGVDDVDVAARAVGVGAGVTIGDVQRAAVAAGLDFGVDLASRDSATVGGAIATNAGGIHFVRYGGMRAQLLGIEAVLTSGEVLRRWRPLRKDNVGYDLPGLLAGSEGTLAVITGALLRLVPQTRRGAVAVVAVQDPARGLAVIDAVERAGLTLHAAELMTEAGLDLVHRHGQRRALPAGTPFAVLIEVAGADAGDLAAVLAEASVDDAAIDDSPAADLWALRERHTESIARDSTTPVVKLDLTLPAGALGAFVATVERLAAAAGVRPIMFGHLADGNVHVNLLDVDPAHAEDVTDAVLREVAAVGGSISAEHGVGRAKAPWLGLGRDAVDVAAMRAIKRVLDPAGLLNPGVLGL